MIEWIAAGLILIGALISFLAALGILRMPDFYCRLQSSTKASTLGIGCVVVAAAMTFEDVGTCAHSILVGAFVAVTTPVAAQLICRAAHAEGVPLWQGTLMDKLKVAELERPEESRNEDSK